MVRLLGAIALTMCVACVATPGERCDDGRLCPSGMVCDDRHRACVESSQLSQCKGQPDGTACTYRALPSAACYEEVCYPAGCGNGHLDEGEVCDFGDQQDGDGCSADCRSDEVCGNGIIDVRIGERCDDGNDIAGDGCTDCRLPSCGDGSVDPGEKCDDGNVDSGDGCNSACTSDETCGNGVIDVQKGEQCDDHGVTPGDGCGPTCKIEVCGNNVLDPGEVCDDGGTLAGDGCSPDCRSNETCGNTIVDPSSEACDLGGANSQAPDAVCRTDCTIRRCGDGIVDPGSGELCEAADLRGVDCLDFGFYDAPGLACGGLCSFDTSACTGYCGDRLENGPEACDGRTAEASCVALGKEAGRATCLSSCNPDISGCTSPSDPWEPMDVPYDYYVDVLAFSSDNALAIGGSGTLVHYDGTAWTEQASPSPFWTALFGTGPTDVFAIGNAVYHDDGTGWAVSPGGSSLLYAGWSASPTEAFAVGSGGLIQHYTGGSWSAMTSGTTADLYAVWGAGPSDVFAVGAGGAIRHWNGTSWSAMTSGVTSPILGVWGLNGADVYATTWSGGLLHYNGASWTKLAFPNFADLTGIWGTGPSDIYVASYDSAVFHYDGQQWKAMNVPNIAGFDVYYYKVHGSGPGDVWVVGDEGSLEHFDISTWGFSLASDAGFVFDAWGDGTGDVIGVGNLGNIARIRGNAVMPMVSNTAVSLTSVHGTAPDRVYAVGTNTLVRYDGATWAPQTIPAGTWRVLFSRPNDEVYVGSFDGTIMQRKAGSWSTVPSPAGALQIDALWADDNQVLVYSDKALRRYASGAWTSWAVPASWFVTRVQIRGPLEVYALGSDGLIGFFDGTSWRAMETGTTTKINDLAGNGPHDLYAVGGSGLALHYDGVAWSPIAMDASSYNGKVVTSKGRIVVFGNPELWTRGRACRATETCGNGTDDDCDGYVDCGDPDCAASCTNGGACAGATPVTCGSQIAGTTVNELRRFSGYGCDPWLEYGREALYRFDSTSDGTVTASLTGLSTDLDLIVLGESATGACEPRHPGCITSSSTTGNESVSFAVRAGKSYWLVVDGIAGVTAGTFSLSVMCP